MQNQSRSQTAPQEAEDTDNLIVEENEYNPFASPPDVSKALKHQKAAKIGKINMNAKKMEMCECCSMPTNPQPLSICGARLDLSSLGAGFPLYFEYVVYCAALLVFLFVIVGIAALTTNMKGTACAFYKDSVEYPCKGGFIIDYSLGNVMKANNYDLVSGLSLLFVVVSMVFVTFYRAMQAKTADRVDTGMITSSDYTVMVSEIPKTETAEKIKAFFEGKGRKGITTNVRNVNLAYEIGTYIALVRKKTQLGEKIAQGKASQRQKKQMNMVEEKLKEFENADERNSATRFTGIAFVTFNTESEAFEVTRRFQVTGFQKLWYAFCCCFGWGEDRQYLGEYIKVKKAPDAMDVFWENLGHDWWDTVKIRILSFIISVILMAMSFGSILGISIWQESVKKNSAHNSSLITFLAFLSSYLVTIINTMIGIFLRKLAGLEKHTTWTYYFISVAKKLSFAQFINTALLTTIVQLFRTDGFNLWIEDSMVSKVFFLFLLNAFMPSISYIFNPMFLLRLYKRRKLASEAEKSKMTQQQANVLFEGPPLDPAQRFANIQKTLLFTGFYATLVPIGILFSLAGLIITYWTDKYMLLRRHSRPRVLGQELAEEMAKFMYLFIVAFATGNVVFESAARGSTTGFSTTALVFAILFYLLPHECCIKCCHKARKFVNNYKRYDEVKHSFLTDYDRANPITQEEATRTWITEMYGKDDKGQIPENIAAYLQQVPRQTQFGSLANYAQNNPSLRQMHKMNGNGNFNLAFIPRPQPIMLLRPVLMNRSEPVPMQLMNPTFPVRLIPQQLQAFYPRVMPNGLIPNFSPPRPIIASIVPPPNLQQVSIPIPQSKPEVAKHLPQQQAPIRHPTYNQPPQPSPSPIPGSMIESQRVAMRPSHIQPQLQPPQMHMNMSINQPMMPMNQPPVMQYPGMMPPNNIPMVQQVQMAPFGGQPQGQFGFPLPQQQFGMQYNTVPPQFGMQQPMMPTQHTMGGQPGFGQNNQRF